MKGQMEMLVAERRVLQERVDELQQQVLFFDSCC